MNNVTKKILPSLGHASCLPLLSLSIAAFFPTITNDFSLEDSRWGKNVTLQEKFIVSFILNVESLKTSPKGVLHKI